MIVALLAPALAKPLPFDVLKPDTAVPDKGFVDATSSLEIAAPPEVVRAFVVDLPKWDQWTSWNSRKYPDMKNTYTGNPGEVGHAMAWTGESSGNGKLALTTVAADGLAFDLWFEKEKDPSKGRITITPTATGSKVEWEMVVAWGFPASLFFPAKKMEAALVKDFDEGLAALKPLAEAEAARIAEEARKAEEAAKKAAEEAAAAEAAKKGKKKK
ncbi:MAG: SRPBCC family protein [Myxococcota bacterium]